MTIEYKKLIGAKIKELRLLNNLTQEQLSAKLQVIECDITRSALAKIEIGQRNLYIDELKSLRKILNVSYEDIIL